MRHFISQATRLLINSLHIYVRLIAVIILFSEMAEELDHKNAHKACIPDLTNCTTQIHVPWGSTKESKHTKSATNVMNGEDRIKTDFLNDIQKK